MPSLRAKLVNRFLRTTMKKMPLHEMALEKVRKIFDNATIPGIPKKVDLEIEDGAVKGEWHRLSSGDADNLILYFHGGGYVFGSPKVHRSLSYPLALHANADVFSLDYRRAPENPCPAAIDDAMAAYQWLRVKGYDPAKISFIGDSAGAGLALATLQALKLNGEPVPSCAVLYSPYLDLAIEGASAKANAERDAMFQLESVKMGGIHYAGDLDLKDPQVSPLYGEMRGLPPLLVFASTDEILYDDSTRLVRRAEQEGIDVSFISREGLVHAWPIFNALMPEGKEAVVKSAAFVRKHIRP